MFEPTEEQVEAAAKAMKDATSGFFSEGSWRYLEREGLATTLSAPVQVDEAKLAELLKKHRQAVYEWAEGDGCLCGITLQGDGGLKPGPEEVAEHISAVIVEWLRGGGQ